MSNKLTNCPHCNEELNLIKKGATGNHIRWCNKNPSYEINRQRMRRGQAKADLMRANAKISKKESGRKNQYSVAKIDGKIPPISPMKGRVGTMKGKKHTQDSKDKIRDAQLKLDYSRKSKKTTDYVKLDGSIVRLDSSWEIKFAEGLDKLRIEWERPKPIYYTDLNNIRRRYFPDFYIYDLDMYIDVKNPYVLKRQKLKFDCLRKEYYNILVIVGLHNIELYLEKLALVPVRTSNPQQP